MFASYRKHQLNFRILSFLVSAILKLRKDKIDFPKCFVSKIEDDVAGKSVIISEADDKSVN